MFLTAFNADYYINQTGEFSQNETSESTIDDVLPSEPDDCFTAIMNILQEPENSSETSFSVINKQQFVNLNNFI